jgi:uncharacterized protein (TIRG00374 family)
MPFIMDFSPEQPQTQTDDNNAANSIKTSRIILPAILGAAVVIYLFWRQFDADEFKSLAWNARMAWGLTIAVALAVIRHLAYTLRLNALTHGALSFTKSIKSIFLWEFASSVSPTAVGGSAVALFILTREKIGVAKSTAVVLYTVVLDSLFMMLFVPILYLIFGPGIMRPGATTFTEAGAWGYYFLFAYLGMAAYTGLFFYGTFIGPNRMKRFLGVMTSFKILRRFRRQSIVLGNEFVTASESLRRERFGFHLRAFGYTFLAWVPRFLILSAVIAAFIPSLPLDFMTQLELYARLKTMFFVLVFSPTPGGAGLIELLFGGFLSDYVSSGTISTVIATVWRLISYYFYLLAGVLLIPAWLRKTSENV